MNKQAQAAVETLMIYGVTIFIVMLAIGALIGFGVIDLGKLLPDKCDITNGFSCEAYAITNSEVGQDVVQLQLKNIAGSNIANFSINIKGEGDNEGLWNCDEVWYSTGRTDHILASGVVSDIIEIPCNIQIPPGRKITGVINIKYTPVGLKLPQPVTGTIRATVS